MSSQPGQLCTGRSSIQLAWLLISTAAPTLSNVISGITTSACKARKQASLTGPRARPARPPAGQIRSQIPVTTTSTISSGAASSARPAESTVASRPCLSRSEMATHRMRAVTPATANEDRHSRRHHAARVPSFSPAAPSGRRSLAVPISTCEADNAAPRATPSLSLRGTGPAPGRFKITAAVRAWPLCGMGGTTRDCRYRDTHPGRTGLRRSTVVGVTTARLDLTRQQILAFRRHTGALDERLPAGRSSLRRGARAGLQDSMPRAAAASIHARVEGTGPSTWEDPSLVQIWGPRFSVFVVPARDLAVFTLGTLPDDARGRKRAQDLAARLATFLGGTRMTYAEAG